MLGGLVLDDDDAANAVFDRCVFAFRVNVHVDGAGVSHRIALVDGQIVREEKLLLDRGVHEAEIDCRPRAEFGQVESCSADRRNA